MLYRLIIFSITAFWLVMMGLLVRLETHPGASNILDVPVSYVFRIMFMHGQQSFLTVREQGDYPIGNISLRPSITAAGGRSLAFAGAMAIQLPLAARQRFSFNGVTDMDVALRMLDFHFNLTLQDPHLKLSAKGDAARNVLTYQIAQGDQVIAARTLPMTSAALGAALMQSMGQPSSTLPIDPGSVTPPVITARETQITLRGEKMDVYDISIREGTMVSADLYVSQVGQLVQATTNFGYSLTAEDYQ